MMIDHDDNGDDDDGDGDDDDDDDNDDDDDDEHDDDDDEWRFNQNKFIQLRLLLTTALQSCASYWCNSLTPRRCVTHDVYNTRMAET